MKAEEVVKGRIYWDAAGKRPFQATDLAVDWEDRIAGYHRSRWGFTHACAHPYWLMEITAEQLAEWHLAQEVEG